MTQDHARLGKAVLCIYVITSSTVEKGCSQKGEESLFNTFSFYCCCLLKYARKRHFSIVLNVLLAKCYKYSPSSQFTEIVCDSFFPFCLLDSNCGYLYSSKAFLFSLVNKPGWAPVKLSQTGKYSSYRYSINSCPSYGPIFGGGSDIWITNYASSNTDSLTNLGHTYSPPSGHSYLSSFARSFLAGSYYFQPDEVEVFYESTK